MSSLSIGAKSAANLSSTFNPENSVTSMTAKLESAKKQGYAVAATLATETERNAYRSLVDAWFIDACATIGKMERSGQTLAQLEAKTESLIHNLNNLKLSSIDQSSTERLFTHLTCQVQSSDSPLSVTEVSKSRAAGANLYKQVRAQRADKTADGVSSSIQAKPKERTAGQLTNIPKSNCELGDALNEAFLHADKLEEGPVREAYLISVYALFEKGISIVNLQESLSLYVSSDVETESFIREIQAVKNHFPVHAGKNAAATPALATGSITYLSEASIIEIQQKVQILYKQHRESLPKQPLNPRPCFGQRLSCLELSPSPAESGTINMSRPDESVAAAAGFAAGDKVVRAQMDLARLTSAQQRVISQTGIVEGATKNSLQAAEKTAEGLAHKIGKAAKAIVSAERTRQLATLARASVPAVVAVGGIATIYAIAKHDKRDPDAGKKAGFGQPLSHRDFLYERHQAQPALASSAQMQPVLPSSAEQVQAPATKKPHIPSFDGERFGDQWG